MTDKKQFLENDSVNNGKNNDCCKGTRDTIPQFVADEEHLKGDIVEQCDKTVGNMTVESNNNTENECKNVNGKLCVIQEGGDTNDEIKETKTANVVAMQTTEESKTHEAINSNEGKTINGNDGLLGEKKVNTDNERKTVQGELTIEHCYEDNKKESKCMNTSMYETPDKEADDFIEGLDNESGYTSEGKHNVTKEKSDLKNNITNKGGDDANGNEKNCSTTARCAVSKPTEINQWHQTEDVKNHVYKHLKKEDINCSQQYTVAKKHTSFSKESRHQRQRTQSGLNDEHKALCETIVAGNKNIQKQVNAVAKFKMCDFCQNLSSYMCETCTFYYCESCVGTVHPAKGPFKLHNIVPTLMSANFERCQIHGVAAKLFCNICKGHICVECANSKCYLHLHSGVGADDVAKGKQLLLDELEKASAAFNELDAHQTKAEDDLESIQNKAILRREQIRQEFVAYHDLLVEKEFNILQTLDKEVDGRLCDVRNGLEKFPRLKQEDARLTSDVIDLVQLKEGLDFVKDAILTQDACKCFINEVEDLRSSLEKRYIPKHAASAVLDQQFSLFVEKKTLSSQMDQIHAEAPKITFKQKTIFLKNVLEPFVVDVYLLIPTLPPSTTVVYTVQVLEDIRTLVWTTETQNLKSIVLNTMKTCMFWFGKRYILKIKPTFVHHISAITTEVRHGTPTHMMICISEYSPREKKTEEKEEEEEEEKEEEI